MRLIFGIVIVVASVIGGYVAMGGHLAVLVQPFEALYLPVNAQYLVHPAGRVGVRKIERFREWLHEELAADRDMMPPQVWEPL